VLAATLGETKSDGIAVKVAVRDNFCPVRNRRDVLILIAGEPQMKPGMQRDILVAFWFLFDEFEIGEDDRPVLPPEAPESVPPPNHPPAKKP